MCSNTNFFILTILKNIFLQIYLWWKRFSYLDPGKNASLGGALGALQGATMIAIIHGHVDQGTPQRIVWRH
jgi:hypothetical protein